MESSAARGNMRIEDASEVAGEVASRLSKLLSTHSSASHAGEYGASSAATTAGVSVECADPVGEDAPFDSIIAATDKASMEVGALLSSRHGAPMHLFCINHVNDGPGPALCIRKTIPSEDLVMSIRFPVNLQGRKVLIIKLDGHNDSAGTVSWFMDWITKLGVSRIAAFVCNNAEPDTTLGVHSSDPVVINAKESSCPVINLGDSKPKGTSAAVVHTDASASSPPPPPQVPHVSAILADAPAPAVGEQAAPSTKARHRQRRFSYFIASADSNCPGEDRSSVHLDDERGIAGFGVFDGHGGNLACDIAAGSLIDDTMERLNALSTEQLDEPSIVVQHIKEAFVNCDEFILDEAYNLLKSKQAQNAVISVPGTNTSHTAAGRPQQPLQFSLRDLKSHVPATGRIPERAGSCAVVANVVKDHLYLSHVGDCRAVIFKNRPPNSSPSDNKSLLEVVVCGDAFECLDTNDVEGGGGRNSSNSAMHRQRSVSGAKPPAVLPENGGSKFRGCSLGSTVEVQGITEDHSCTLPSERDRVADRTSDPTPFRPSRGDLSIFGPSAPVRVAGSLAVTRAFGDGYLKRRELSVDPYAEHLPYISCDPVVNHRRIMDTDLGLVLASDGFWNYVTAYDVAQVLEKYICGINHGPDGTKSGHKRRPSFDESREGRVGDSALYISPGDSEGSGAVLASPAEPITRHEHVDGHDSSSLDPAEMLLDMCIANAARGLGMPASRLRRMVPGQARREIIDDVTVLVVLFDHGHPPRSAGEGMDSRHDEASANGIYTTNVFESPFHHGHKSKKHKSSHRDTSSSA